MSEKDILAECSAEAIKECDGLPEYHYIDQELCTNYARLERGAWSNDSSGCEYWEERYFTDSPEGFLDSSGEPFTDWKE